MHHTLHNDFDGRRLRRGQSKAVDPTGVPSLFESVLVFLVPCLMFVQTKIIGQLFLTEIILLAILPVLIVNRGRMFAARLPRALMLLCLLWLLGQVVTDVVRGTPYEDYSRGWAKIFFTLSNFMALYLLIGGRKTAIFVFLLGWSTGQILAFKLIPTQFTLDAPWKFGLGVPVTLLVVLLGMTPTVARYRLLPVGLIWFMVAVNIYSDFRSLGGVCFFTGVYLLLQRVATPKRGSDPWVAPRPRVPVLLFAGIVMSAVALLGMYEYAASGGLLGAAAQDKYEAQSSGSYGILLGGRTESVASTRAIIDSPILGHGSWARDTNGRYYALIQSLTALGYRLSGDQKKGYTDGLIPTHSHLLGAWVEAGVLGAVFWLWVLRLILRVLSDFYPVRHQSGPLVVFLSLLFGWDVLFSPFGAERRVFNAFIFVVLIFACEVIRQNTSRASRWMGVA